MAATPKTVKAATTTIEDPNYFVKKRLELEAERIGMEAKAQFELDTKMARLRLGYSQKQQALKLQEARAIRVSR